MEEEQRIQQRETDILSLVSPVSRRMRVDSNIRYVPLSSIDKKAHNKKTADVHTRTPCYPRRRSSNTAVVSEWVSDGDGRPNESKNIQKLKHVIAGANEWV